MAASETVAVEREYGGANPHLALNIYKLFCYFAASRPLEAEGRIDSGGYWLLLIKLKFEEDEIRHLLVTIAAQLRSGRDIVKATESRSTPDEVSARSTGEIYQPASSTEACDLSFKDACDKILHAAAVSFETAETDLRKKWIYYYLLPRIRLSGSRYINGNRIDWKAALDVYAFLRVAAEAAALYWRPLTHDEKRMNRMLRMVSEMDNDKPIARDSPLSGG